MTRKVLQVGLAVSLVGCLLFLTLALLEHQTQAQSGSPVYVGPGSDCGGMLPCYAHPQDAVDAAQDGDIIKVAAGTYAGANARPRKDIATTGVVTQVVYISKTVTVRGGYRTDDWSSPDPQANVSSLDAEGQGRVLYVTGDISPTIEGLQITGGDADGLGGCPFVVLIPGISPEDGSGAGGASEGFDAGGGVYVITASLVLSGCQITDGRAVLGGGIYVHQSDITLKGNVVGENTARAQGGGLSLYYSDATLSGNTVLSNIASDGGGLWLYDSDAMLTQNTVSGNVAEGNCGGLCVWNSDPILSGNRVLANRARYDGGGLHLYGSDATLDSNVIADNEALGKGAGMFARSSSLRLQHTTLASNRRGDGSGLHVTDDGWGSYHAVILTNTILVSHTVGITVAAGSTATLEATLWGSGAWANETDWGGSGTILTGTVNLWSDPRFIDAAAGDYHIGPASSAVDAGVDAGVLGDMDGDPRPAGLGYDIGADERAGAVLRLQKGVWPRCFNPGQAVTYTLLVTAMGTTTATNVVITDTLPVQQQWMTAMPSQGACISGHGWGAQAVCTLGDIGPGNTAQVTLTTQATTMVPGPLPYPVRHILLVRGDNAANKASLDVYLHDCRARVNGGLREYTEVQAAVDAAAERDTVMLAGVCGGMNERDGLRQAAYLSKTLTVRGGYSKDFSAWDPVAYPTILHGQGQGRVLYIVGEISPTIEGLQITGGDARGLGGTPEGYDAGGGVCVIMASPVLSGCEVVDNASPFGGGVYLERSSATLSDNVVSGNRAECFGGGLSLYYSDAILSNNRVTDNEGGKLGGGLYLDTSNATVSGNTISGNRAEGLGGGLYLYGSDAVLKNNVIANNQANVAGSGLYIGRSSPLLLHTTIARNIGGDGSGVYVTEDYPSTVELINTILVSHTLGLHVTGSNRAVLQGTLWYGNGQDTGGDGTIITGTVNVYGDPAFADPGVGDYHIGPTSAAIDRGVEAGVSTDIDGHPRPMGDGFDIGADEHWPPGLLKYLYLPVLLRSAEPPTSVSHAQSLRNASRSCHLPRNPPP